MRKAGQVRRGGDSGTQSPVKRRKKESDEKNSTVTAHPPDVFIPTRAPKFSPRYQLPQENSTGHLGTIVNVPNVASRSSLGIRSISSELNNRRYNSNSHLPIPTSHKSIHKSSSVITKSAANSASTSQDIHKLIDIEPQNTLGGAILNINLKNFMNHCKLDWSPIKHVNIITGANGAGKSSILQAIVLGLGGIAKSMKRHSSVGKFVQKSTNKAEIRITIDNHNRGDDAYKHEIYSDKIVFERIIYASGMSVQNIRNGKSMALVYTGKQASDERERILDHYNIALDNPVTILHQEQAKTFFCQKDTEKNLWEFVMASTQMKSIQDEYRDSKTQLELASSQLEEKRKYLLESRQELSDLTTKEKAFQKFQFNNKNKNYNEMIKWGWANDCKKKYENSKKLREEKSAETEILRNNLAGWNASLEDLNRKKGGLELENNKVKDDAREKADEIDKVKNDLRILTEKKHQVESSFKEINTKQGEKRVRIRKLNNEIIKAKTLNGIYAIETKHQKETLVQNLRDLEADKEQNSNEIKRLGNGRNDIEMQEEEKTNEKNTMKQNLKVKQKEQDFRKDFLNKYKTQSLGRFGERIIRLEKEIDDYHRDSNVFTKRPIGPMGRYMRLKNDATSDNKLARLLEIELGVGLLISYICNCRKDREILDKIIKPIWGQGKPPTIYTRTLSDEEYSVVEISRYSADTKNSTLHRVMDYLQFDDPNVFNLVVDQKQIEQVLVVTTDEVERLFARIDTVPKNTKYAITREKFKYFPPSRTQNYSSYYMPHSKNSTPILVGDFRDEEQQNHSAVQKIEEEVQRIEDNLKIIENEEKTLRKRGIEIKVQQDKLKEKHSRVLMEITKVRAQIRDGDEDTKSIKDILRLKEECEEESNQLDEKKKPLLNEKDEIFKQILRAEDLLKKAISDVNRILSNGCDHTISELQRQVDGKEREIQRLTKDHDKYLVDMKQLIDEARKQEQKSKSAEKEALKYCNGRRVSVTKDIKELDALKKEYEKQEKQFLNSVKGQSYEDFQLRKCKKGRQVQDLDDFVSLQTRNLDQVKNMVQKRKKFFVTMRSMSMRLISRNFCQQMDMHNLEGKLTPHYKLQMLDVNVRPKTSSPSDLVGSSSTAINNGLYQDSTIMQDTDKDIQGRNFSLSSLSGGERSKTLVCLINSLWKIQQPPLRCLDEWDVFLDAVARKQIEGMLVKTALSTGHQYFFISPQGSMFADTPKKEWKDLNEKMKKQIQVFTIKK